MVEKKEITFKIVKSLGVLSQNTSGWQKEINIVSWNGGAEKYDIREWDEEHERMSKGITLKEEEAKILAEAIIEHQKGNEE